MNSSLPPPGLADRALVADLAAALGVERRSVEHDLGRAVAGELVELDAVAHDRDDPALGGRGLVAQELGVAVAALDRAVQRGQLRVARRDRPSCPTGCAPAARRGRPGTPRGPRVNPYSAASSTVRSTGKPYVSWSRKATSPSRTGRVRRQVLRPAADDALGRRATGRVADGLLEQLRAGIEGPGELGLLAQDRGQDRSRFSTRCGKASAIVSITTAAVSAMNGSRRPSSRPWRTARRRMRRRT